MRDPDRAKQGAGGADIGARLMLVLLCLIWGITWPLMKIALLEIPPFSMRAISGACGAATLYLVCLAKGRSLRVSGPRAWMHMVIAAFLNLVCFSMLITFAQLYTATSRATILAYMTPIWTVLLAWPILGERPTRVQMIALALCAAGLIILIYPLAASGIPVGVLFAIAAGVSWAAGTIHLKLVRIDGDPMGIASWQLTIAFAAFAAFVPPFEGHLQIGAAHAGALLAAVFTGVAASGIAYALWFEIVRRLPAVTATLGVLSVPVIGILSSVAILGEAPTVTDIIGFALIFAASACVLLTRQAPAEATP